MGTPTVRSASTYSLRRICSWLDELNELISTTVYLTAQPGRARIWDSPDRGTLQVPWIDAPAQP